MSTPVEHRLRELGLELPNACPPRGNFLPYRLHGGLAYMAGQICEWNGTVPHVGPVLAEHQAPPASGPWIDLETGRRAAELCALDLLFHLRAACDGDLGRVAGVLRVGGFVNCLGGFDRSPAVVNGASDLFIALWGDAGRHARTAVGVAGLPANASVEIDAIFILR